MRSKVQGADHPDSIKLAAEILNQGGVIITPTETLYGFTVNALMQNAIHRIDTLKDRKFKETYILLMRNREMAQTQYQIIFDRLAEKLANRFWPGPLTMVLPVEKESPLIHLASMGTLAIRVSPDPFIQALFRTIDFPIVSTSVNKSGKTPHTDPQRMEKEFGDEVDMIFERGIALKKEPSTLVAITDNVMTILRPGAITEEELYGL